MLVFIGVFLVACGEVEESSGENADQSNASSSEDSADNSEKTEDGGEEDAGEKVYTIGDSVEVNGVEITIKSATFTKPAEYSEPKNDKVLTLEVEAKNTSDDSAFVDNTEFTLSDAEGNMSEDYFGYDDLAISGDINSGKKLSGKLYYDVSESDHYELQYEPSFSWDEIKINWEIKKDQIEEE